MNDLENLASGFGKLFLRLHRLVDRRMASGGASFARAKMLMCIKKDGPARAVDIADLFGLAPRTVTEALDGLERDGLVRRAPDPHDRRVKRVSLTDDGLSALAASEPLRLELLDRTFGALDAEERAQLAAIVAKLTVQVEREEARD
ncbi:MarR family winged helix-turn-helix transcriptional regulator [Sphingomonas sp.]|uniref:MarR family winged helix-turn-helix transcriptional regulator n=1 Tax=Sphingomonas sp. TaxID=28214 RepID=UPI002CC3C6AF|nr:MarR family transcriptional regulator [Sphingomonas sp.]HWK35730.1 MarR family transcriptional regulator [Sphingomonas sp.]